MSVVFLILGDFAHAQFTNGSFEDGTFNGWTVTGGKWSDNGTTQNFPITGDPGTSAIVTTGNDAQSNNLLPVVPLPSSVFGTHAARVNDQNGGSDFTIISQQTVWKFNAINFAWAAVLQDPGHPAIEQPFFKVTLTDVTKNLVIYNQAYNATTIQAQSVIKLNTGVGNWLYTNWNVEHLNTKAYKGDTLKVEIWGADCDQGGHGGYVYVDHFTPDSINIGGNPTDPVVSGMPMALAQRQMLFNLVENSTRDVNERLFRMRIRTDDTAAPAPATDKTTGGKDIVDYKGNYKKDAKNTDSAVSSRLEFFATGNYGYNSEDNLGSTPGFNTNSYLATVGAEYRLNDYITLGLATGYAGSTNSLGDLGKTDINGGNFTGYLSWFWKNFYADALYSFGFYEQDISRNTTLNTTASSSPDSRSNTAEFNLGYNMLLHGFVTGPNASLEYVNGIINSYTETGGDSADLWLSEQHINSLISRLGWHVSYPIITKFGFVTPQVRANWSHQLLNQNQTVSSALLTSPTIYSQGSGALGDDYLDLGAGVQVGFGDRYSVVVDYDTHLLQTNGVAQFVSVMGSVKF